jgi:hypothetical protein
MTWCLYARTYVYFRVILSAAYHHDNLHVHTYCPAVSLAGTTDMSALPLTLSIPACSVIYTTHVNICPCSLPSRAAVSFPAPHTGHSYLNLKTPACSGSCMHVCMYIVDHIPASFTLLEGVLQVPFAWMLLGLLTPQ